MESKVCATCAFFRSTGNDRGECRHHAPLSGNFPEVQRLAWCGDWASSYLEYDGARTFGTRAERAWRLSYSNLREDTE